MAYQRTLSIIKPDAVEKGHIGEIISRFEKNALKISAVKMISLSRKDAEDFYSEHYGKSFYDGLIQFMSSGPSIVLILEGDNCIEIYRNLMGPTNSPDGEPGTLRRDFGENNRRNAVHGSDSPESAEREITFFFKPEEIHV